MAGRIDKAWASRVSKEIDGKTFVKAVVSHNINAKWLIGRLARENIPVKVLNLGAGVKKIVVMENVCPTCGGKGFVNDKHGNTNNGGS